MSQSTTDEDLVVLPERSAALLEPYIQDALPDETGPIFKVGSDCSKKPALQKGRTNQIILYGGNFNPPHRGHLALLKHTFENCGADMNIIAAIVYITDDYELRGKMSSQSGTMVLSWKQRHQLWKEATEEVDWCWIYDGNEGAPTSKFRSGLFGGTKEDGFDVDFVWLFGPDHITTRFSPTYFPFSVKTIMTSNIDRPVDFIASKPGSPTKLTRLGGFEPWERLHGEEQAVSQAAERSTWLSYLSSPFGFHSQPEQIDSQDSAAPASSVWVCRLQRSPGYTIRFIQSHQPMNQDISSTNIRRMVANTRAAQLLSQVRHVALSPDLLAVFSREKKR